MYSFHNPSLCTCLHMIFFYEYAVWISHRALHMLELVLEEELGIQFREKYQAERIEWKCWY